MRAIDADALLKNVNKIQPWEPYLGKYAQGIRHCMEIVGLLIKDAPTIESSAQPERLSDDDFETIRIHLNACKEKLCNQHRWEEAEEYQRIIDRFMAFASTQPEQPEITHCRDCENWDKIGFLPELWRKNGEGR